MNQRIKPTLKEEREIVDEMCKQLYINLIRWEMEYEVCFKEEKEEILLIKNNIKRKGVFNEKKQI
jgi:hypothetical protein